MVDAMEEYQQDFPSLVDMIANAFRDQSEAVLREQGEPEGEPPPPPPPPLREQTERADTQKPGYALNHVELANIAVGYIYAFIVFEHLLGAYYRMRDMLADKLDMIHQSMEEADDTYILALMVDKFLHLNEAQILRQMKSKRYQSHNWDKRVRNIKERLNDEDFRAILFRNSLIMKEVVYHGESLAKKNGYNL